MVLPCPTRILGSHFLVDRQDLATGHHRKRPARIPDRSSMDWEEHLLETMDLPIFSSWNEGFLQKNEGFLQIFPWNTWNMVSVSGEDFSQRLAFHHPWCQDENLLRSDRQSFRNTTPLVIIYKVHTHIYNYIYIYTYTCTSAFGCSAHPNTHIIHLPLSLSLSDYIHIDMTCCISIQPSEMRLALLRTRFLAPAAMSPVSGDTTDMSMAPWGTILRLTNTSWVSCI